MLNIVLRIVKIYSNGKYHGNQTLPNFTHLPLKMWTLLKQRFKNWPPCISYLGQWTWPGGPDRDKRFFSQRSLHPFTPCRFVLSDTDDCINVVSFESIAKCISQETFQLLRGSFRFLLPKLLVGSEQVPALPSNHQACAVAKRRQEQNEAQIHEVADQLIGQQLRFAVDENRQLLHANIVYKASEVSSHAPGHFEQVEGVEGVHYHVGVAVVAPFQLPAVFLPDHFVIQGGFWTDCCQMGTFFQDMVPAILKSLSFAYLPTCMFWSIKHAIERGCGNNVPLFTPSASGLHAPEQRSSKRKSGVLPV